MIVQASTTAVLRSGSPYNRWNLYKNHNKNNGCSDALDGGSPGPQRLSSVGDEDGRGRPGFFLGGTGVYEVPRKNSSLLLKVSGSTHAKQHFLLGG